MLSLVPKYKVIRQYTRVPHLYPKAGVGVFTLAPSRNRTQAQSPQHQVWTYQRRLSLTHNSTLYDLSLRHSWWKKRPVQQDGTDIKSMLTERRHFLSASKGRVARLSVRTNEARVLMQLHVPRMSSFKKWGLWLCNTTRLEEAKERFILTNRGQARETCES